MKIKICGMKYPENTSALGELLPDYMGFIFWEKSSRFFDGIIPELPKPIKKVGVFVNASSQEIQNKIERYQLDLVQLHGQESVAFCKSLEALPIEIIKVFSVDDTFDFAILEDYESVCDYFLFDTKGKLPGGNGISFNWDLLKKYKSKKPLFLSGGIGLEEIQKIIEANLPIYAIDVNSKFEIEPGLKDLKQSGYAIAHVATKNQKKKDENNLPR